MLRQWEEEQAPRNPSKIFKGSQVSRALMPGEAPGKDLEGTCPGREGAAGDWKALDDLL